jgi:hypothetical protein
MDRTARERSARWRDRQRVGALSVKVDVLPKHRRALEAIGLIAPGNGRNSEAVAWAVLRYLDTSPAMQAMGEALYPDWPEDEEEVECDTACADNTVQNEE